MYLFRESSNVGLSVFGLWMRDTAIQYYTYNTIVMRKISIMQGYT